MANTYNSSGINIQDGIIDNTNPQQNAANIQNTTDYINSPQFATRIYQDIYYGTQIALQASTDNRLLQLGTKMDLIRQLYQTYNETITQLNFLANTFNDLAAQIVASVSIANPPQMRADKI